jgi:arabinose-5-phosphate isomerase
MKELETFKRYMSEEVAAIEKTLNSFGEEIVQAINAIQNSRGKVVITGVGKSGHIGKKIAATLASTGTPSFFMHSTEGVHGDLGMVGREDVVILISNSGETLEVLNLLPSLKQIGCKMISLTGNHKSSLALNCDISLAYDCEREIGELGFAPSASSTITLVVGDALALTLSKLRNFSKQDFNLYHPGGSLGKKSGGKE